MRPRKELCAALMLASAALVAGAFTMPQHPTRRVVALARGDLIFYPLFALAAAIFMTSYIAGWHWEGVLGERRRTLLTIFGTFFGVLVLMGLGPVAVVSALGKGEDWVENLRGWPTMAVLAWQTIAAARRGAAPSE